MASLLQGSRAEADNGVQDLRYWSTIPLQILEIVVQQLDKVSRYAYQIRGEQYNQTEFWQSLAHRSRSQKRQALLDLSLSRRLQQPALEAVRLLMSSEDDFVAVRAARALANQEMPKDDDKLVSTPSKTLSRQGTCLEDVAARPVELRSDADKIVVSPAAQDLNRQETLSPDVITCLVEQVKDGHFPAAVTLSRQKVISEATTALLVELLKDNRGMVDAFMILSEQTTLLEPVAARLVELLKDRNWRVARSAVEILGRQTMLSGTTTLKAI